MKPSELIALNLINLPFGKSKVFERARELRKMGLFPNSKTGPTDQVSLKCAYLFLYVLAVDPNRQQVPFVVDNYAAMKNEETGKSFYDAFPEVFSNLKEVVSVEVSRSFPFVEIHYRNRKETYSVGYTKEQLEDLITTTYRLPKSFLDKYYWYCIQSTNTGYLVEPGQTNDILARDEMAQPEIHKDWPTKEDIIKAIAPTIKRSKYN